MAACGNEESKLEDKKETKASDKESNKDDKKKDSGEEQDKPDEPKENKPEEGKEEQKPMPPQKIPAKLKQLMSDDRQLQMKMIENGTRDLNRRKSRTSKDW